MTTDFAEPVDRHGTNNHDEVIAVLLGNFEPIEMFESGHTYG